MRSFTSFYRFLNLLGLLPCVYSREQDEFIVRKLLIPYSIFLTLAIQVYLLVEGYVHLDAIVPTLNSFGQTEFDWFVTGGLLLFFIFYVILNLSTSFTILYNAKHHCKLLNKLIAIDRESGIDGVNLVTCKSTASGAQKTFEMHVKLAYLTIVAIYFVAFPTYIYGYFGITFLGFARFISIYCHSMQYLLGHLYEMIVIEKLCANFKRLHEQLNDELHLGEYFLTCHRYWKMSKKATALFAFGKIPCLVCVNLILSLYWFCNYDQSQNFVFLFIRQVVLYFIFFVCNNWHRLLSEVSIMFLLLKDFYKLLLFYLDNCQLLCE